MRNAKALAAAASLAVMAIASHASAATEIKLLSATMDTTYQANIVGFGAAYSNGVTFQAIDFNTATNHTVGSQYTLFGFCVDIYHDMYINTPLNYFYTSNQGVADPLPTDGNNNAISTTQLSKITNLVDTGYLLHQAETNANYADTEMRLAAIQAAIWEVEVPTRNNQTTVTVSSANLNTTQFHQYQTYFNNYVAGNYTSLADANDRFYTISDTASDPSHQRFAIGWPIPGVPEPTTWAMMLMGFFGVGAGVRAGRKGRVAATA